MTIHLRVHELQWVNGPDDDPEDLCAHGRVEFRDDDVVFAKPEDGMWTVSAAALSLLRTIDSSHTPEKPVAGAQLFPCCGFSVLPCKGDYDVVWFGCPSGIDLSVLHTAEGVVLHSEAGAQATVSHAEWVSAVVGFADQIKAFYRDSATKAVPADASDRAGWAAFWREWGIRRGAL